MKKIADTDELAELLANPDPIIINGRPVIINKFLIGQLPRARAIAEQLFDEQWLAIIDAEYPVDLTDQQINLMQQLIVLMSDQKITDLEMPTMEFMRLFNEGLKENSDFFLQIMMKAMIPPAGVVSFNGSNNTDTSGLINSH